MRRFGLMRGAQIAHRESARLSTDRSGPSMYFAFEEVVAGFAVEVIWQRLERAPDERLIVGVTERQRVGTRQEPAEHAVSAGIVPGAFVVDAAAAEGVEHEPRTGEATAPERLVEEDRDPQIVARPVVVRDVLSHRASQPLAIPFNCVEPRVRQRDDHCIEVVLHHASALPGGNDVAPVRFVSCRGSGCVVPGPKPARLAR